VIKHPQTSFDHHEFSVNAFSARYNIPCSPVKGNPNNPREYDIACIFRVVHVILFTCNAVEMIKRLCTKADFVMFKLDIDTPSVELPIMKQLLADDVAISLIDEVCFRFYICLGCHYYYYR
jgi:hypothetical protein